MQAEIHAYLREQATAILFTAMSKARRRIRIGVSCEPIDPKAVWQRDRRRCQLCFARTPWSLRGTTASCAPELDHIIPIVQRWFAHVVKRAKLVSFNKISNGQGVTALVA
jgi:5-methylcytosine-specific restriction endonuclease McrA